MFRVSVPNGIPSGIPAPESVRTSEVGSRSGESRNSTPVDALRLSVSCCVAKKSSNATAVEATRAQADGRCAARFGGVMMSDLRDDCLHPGKHSRAIGCPDCGKFSSHSWSTPGESTPSGWHQAWGGTCATHGEWSDSA